MPNVWPYSWILILSVFIYRAKLFLASFSFPTIGELPETVKVIHKKINPFGAIWIVRIHFRQDSISKSRAALKWTWVIMVLLLALLTLIFSWWFLWWPPTHCVKVSSDLCLFRYGFHCITVYIIVLQVADNRLTYVARGRRFPFSFILPPDIPSSYEGKYGSVRYTLKAVIKMASLFKSDYVSKVHVLNVNTVVDLNRNETALVY